MRIRIKDFQALRNFDIEVVGITQIVGENDMGKTSSIRAMLANLSGRLGDDFIRYGAKKSVVGIRFDSDPDNPQEVEATWTKGKGGAQYVLDGEEYSRLGRRGVPLDELAARGLKEIEFSGGRERIQFWSQRTPPFLVSLPPTQVFDFVSRVMEERKVIPVLQNMAKDLTELKERAVLLEGSIQARTRDLETSQANLVEAQKVLTYEPLVASSVVRLTELKELEGTNTRFIDTSSAYERVTRDSDSARVQADRMTAIVEEGSLTLGELKALQRVEGLFEELAEVQGRLSTALDARGFYEKVVVKVLPALELAKILGREVQDLMEVADHYGANFKVLQEVGARLESSRARIGPEVPEEAWKIVADIKELEGAGLQFTATSVAVQSCGGLMEKAVTEVSRAEAAYTKARAEIGVCPLCGAVMGKETDHAHGS